MDADSARERQERIRAHADIADEYIRAVAERDWAALHYPDIEAWRDDTLRGVRIAPETRRQIVGSLSPQMSVRAIAAAVGVRKSTVQYDLKPRGVHKVDTDPYGLWVHSPAEGYAVVLPLDGQSYIPVADLADFVNVLPDDLREAFKRRLIP